MRRALLVHIIVASMAVLVLVASAAAQQPPPRRAGVRTVTIPISIFTKKELKENQTEEYVQADRLIVTEDKDEQEILSIRSVANSPLTIALLIQEDLTSTFNLQIPEIQQFIRELPRGTRVMIGYIRAGTVQIRQKFTQDLDKAASSLRIVAASSALAPRSPYDGVEEILSRFDAVPSGRRAILLFSDGLDTSSGTNPASVLKSFDMERAALKAQRRSIAVYSFYSPTVITDGSNSVLIGAAQGALQQLSDQTGGRAFYQGMIAPISYVPYFRDLNVSLNRQFALTYLSTHMNKGYHNVTVQSTNPEIKIEHPKGYYFR